MNSVQRHMWIPSQQVKLLFVETGGAAFVKLYVR